MTTAKGAPEAPARSTLTDGTSAEGGVVKRDGTSAEGGVVKRDGTSAEGGVVKRDVLTAAGRSADGTSAEGGVVKRDGTSAEGGVVKRDGTSGEGGVVKRDGTSAEGGVVTGDQALRSESGEARLGWPADKELKGVYAHVGMLGSAVFPRLLDHIAKSGLNAVVVDAKDYSGWLTYPSSIPLAAETRASAHTVVSSLPELVHGAHQLGIRVLLRIACFHDAWMASHRRDLAIHGVAEWLDPNNTAAQDYLLSIVDETLAAGVDEMQLDYVRYPTENIGQADFGLGHTKKTDVIAGFVQRVHEHTMAVGVPLSLDIFGVVAWQRSVDVNATGQDLVRLGALAEAISPMVYPSHFSDGFNGYATPGEHPEVVAFGTKQAIEVLKRAGSHAVVRPWIQAFPWHAPGYDTSYVGREIAQARSAEGIGWLAWNAGGYYAEVWAASSMDAKARSSAVQ